MRTVAMDDPGDLIAWAHALQPTAFLRGGDGLVGYGSRVDFVHSAGDRIAALADWWQQLAARAVVHDEVNLPGTGLVAFGSFAFSDDSAQSSILTVPAVVIGRSKGRSWITIIDGGMPVQPTPLGPDFADQLGPGSLEPLTPGAMSPSEYVDAVTTAAVAIADGRANKVVIARDLVGSIPAMADRRHLLSRLAESYPDTYAFAVNGLIGASPETLVRVSGGTVSARVLAGTSARGVDAEADDLARDAISHSPKDLGEHVFALSSVLEALAPHTQQLSASERPFALTLPNLLHLASDVTGTLNDASTPLDLVRALHPTAAVAGTPTDAALSLIAELEPFDRGRYAGPVGWVSATGDGEWAIALRCAHIDDEGNVTAWAGAGIVADSVPERELAETELKFRPIADALGRR